MMVAFISLPVSPSEWAVALFTRFRRVPTTSVQGLDHGRKLSRGKLGCKPWLCYTYKVPNSAEFQK